MKSPRIAALLDSVLVSPMPAQRLLDGIVVQGIALGLEWHEILGAVEEAERRTGQTLRSQGTFESRLCSYG